MPSIGTRNASEIAAAIAQEIAELPDRTSPDDWPEAMLVTADELMAICEREIEAAEGDPANPADGWRRSDDIYMQVLSGKYEESPIGPVKIGVTTGLSVVVETTKGRYILDSHAILAQIMELEGQDADTEGDPADHSEIPNVE